MCFKERIYVCVCARICVYRCLFGVCGGAGTVPGEYWGLGGHVGRASVVWSGWGVRIHFGGMRRLVSSENGGRHGGLMEAYVIVIGWVWVSSGGWGSLGEKSWAQVRQDGP